MDNLYFGYLLLAIVFFIIGAISEYVWKYKTAGSRLIVTGVSLISCGVFTYLYIKERKKQNK